MFIEEALKLCKHEIYHKGDVVRAYVGLHHTPAAARAPALGSCNEHAMFAALPTLGPHLPGAARAPD